VGGGGEPSRKRTGLESVIPAEPAAATTDPGKPKPVTAPLWLSVQLSATTPSRVRKERVGRQRRQGR
jgi:hypothetical protein